MTSEPSIFDQVPLISQSSQSTQSGSSAAAYMAAQNLQNAPLFSSAAASMAAQNLQQAQSTASTVASVALQNVQHAQTAQSALDSVIAQNLQLAQLPPASEPSPAQRGIVTQPLTVEEILRNPPRHPLLHPRLHSDEPQVHWDSRTMTAYSCERGAQGHAHSVQFQPVTVNFQITHSEITVPNLNLQLIPAQSGMTLEGQDQQVSLIQNLQATVDQHFAALENGSLGLDLEQLRHDWYVAMCQLAQCCERSLNGLNSRLSLTRNGCEQLVAGLVQLQQHHVSVNQRLEVTFASLREFLQQLNDRQNALITEVLPGLASSSNTAMQSLSNQCQAIIQRLAGELFSMQLTVKAQSGDIREYHDWVRRVQMYMDANSEERGQLKEEVQKVLNIMQQLSNRVDFVQNSMTEYMRNSGELQAHMNVLSGIAQQLNQAQRAQPSVESSPLLGSILERLSRLESRFASYEAQLHSGQSIMRPPPLAQSVTYTPVSGAQTQEPLGQQVVRSLDSTPIQEGMPSPIPPVVPSSPQTVGSRNFLTQYRHHHLGQSHHTMCLKQYRRKVTVMYRIFLIHQLEWHLPTLWDQLVLHQLQTVQTVCLIPMYRCSPCILVAQMTPRDHKHMQRTVMEHRVHQAWTVVKTFCTVCQKVRKYRGVVCMLDTVSGHQDRTPFSIRQLPKFCEICPIGMVIQAHSQNGTVNGQLQHSF